MILRMRAKQKFGLLFSGKTGDKGTVPVSQVTKEPSPCHPIVCFGSGFVWGSMSEGGGGWFVLDGDKRVRSAVVVCGRVRQAQKAFASW